MHPPLDPPDAAPGAWPSGPALRERDDRLKALKDLVGHLAHDFNNCMVPVVGYVTLLKEEPKIGTRVDQYLSRLESSVRKTEGFLESILEATHPERRFCPKQVDLTALVQKAAETVGPPAHPDRPVTVDLDLVPCTLWLDEAQWTKVLQHLVRNAQASMVRGGTLRISLKLSTLSPEEGAELGVRAGSVVQLDIEDSGQGMSPEVLRRAYEPFFTTRSDVRADGLGLTYVHSVVRLHGGQVAISSVENAGTKVRVWLPSEPTTNA